MTTDRSLERLLDAADDAYRASRTSDAEKLFGRAEELARLSGDIGALAKVLSWRSYCLKEMGEFNPALVKAIEAIKAESPDVDPEYQYMAMIVAINISRLTRPLAEIIRLAAEAEQRLDSWNRREWRHLLISERAHTLHACGRLDNAKSCAWEALRLRDADGSGGPQYLRMGNLATLAQLCLLTADARGMVRAEMEAKNTELKTEACRVNRIAISLFAARLATPHAQLPLAIADQAENAASIVTDDVYPTRTIALTGQWERARRALDKVRPSRLDYEAFELGLVKGDIALMEARAALHLPAVDDEIAADRPLSSKIAGSTVASDLLSCAEATYEAIAPVAVREDSRLETHYYSERLERRHARLSTIWAALE